MAHIREMNAKTIWAFADVDDMLIASTRTAPVDGSVVAAVDGKGAVCGWLTPKQQQFLALLTVGTPVRVVLTTARTSTGVSQLTIPGICGAGQNTCYSIVSFGGRIIMPNGESEPRFRELMAKGASDYKVLIDALCSGMTSYCSEHKIDARVRVASDDGFGLFVSIKHNKRNLEEMAELHRVLKCRLPEGFSLHFNGNFIAAMPPFLGKDKAVQWFMDNYVAADDLTIGLGDSHTDLPFMGLCDMAVTPTASQIFSTLKKSL